jgi:hypothetical protein
MVSEAAFTTDSDMNHKQSFEVRSSEDVPTGVTEKPTSVTGLKYWAKRLAVETGGIERITDEDRAKNPSKVWNACTFW